MTREPAEFRISVNGIELAVTEWPGDGRPILFCHATGFHARIWDQVVARLEGRHRCIAFDARGHGHTSKAAPPYAWRNFGADAAALAEALALNGAIGVGHSLGGHAVTLASALQPSAFAALVLFDPVIRPKDEYRGPWKATPFVRKRRNAWASPREMFERFENRPPFDAWDRQVLMDYCQYALQPNGYGYVLACPPDIEAPIYEASTEPESNIYAEIATIRIPVHIVRAGLQPDPGNIMGLSLTAADLAAAFAHARDTCLDSHSHFIPLESPELAAKFIAEMSALL